MFLSENGFPSNVGSSCQLSSSWECFAPAKLNLFLEILGKRVDGFHELETLMVPVRTYDSLSWSAPRRDNPKLRLHVQSSGMLSSPSPLALPSDRRNLVLQAVERLAEEAGISPQGEFHLVKRIPVEAGMGGGSSDAAAALMLANRCWGIRYSREKLAAIAAQLGSDIPFFLYSKPAICRGRGEQVEILENFPQLHFVIVKPVVGLSTSRVFGELKKYGVGSEASDDTDCLGRLVHALRAGHFAKAGQWMSNRLQSAATALEPQLVRIREVMEKFGFLASLMTGSGTAFVGVTQTALVARRSARKLARMNLGNVFATSTC